ncbi:hypothetical protein MASR2M41_07020 [Flammeovirgaceae bacterium]
MKFLIKVVMMSFFLYSSVALCQNNLERLPALDSILNLSWQQSGQKYSSNPLVCSGLVFETYGLEYALEITEGLKLFYKNNLHQAKIRNLMQDSLIYFSSRAGNKLINIYKGEIIFQTTVPIKKPWIKKPRVIRGDLFAALNDSVFARIDVKSGAVLWQTKIHQVFDFPIFFNEMVYVCGSKYLYCLNSQTGQIVQKIEIGIAESSLILHDKKVFIWIRGKGLTAYDLIMKKQLWTLDNYPRTGEHEVILNNESLYFNSEKLTRVNVKDGSVVWSNNLDSHESFTLGVFDKYILSFKTIDDNSTIVACNRETGRIEFEGLTSELNSAYSNSELNNKVFRFAQPSNDKLVFVDSSGGIYCFRLK